jgi:hypothetical protein
MQTTPSTWRRKGKSEAARGVLGIVLFVLLMGLWAYLWVPPLPIF